MTFYLGDPTTAAGMLTLPDPDTGLQGDLDRDVTEYTTASGGIATVWRPRTRRQFPLTFTTITEDDASVLAGIYTGIYGPGPFCMVDPTWTNMLGNSVSTANARTKTAAGYFASAAGDTVAYSTDTPPFLGTGVIQWVHGSGAGGNLQVARSSLSNLVAGSTGLDTTVAPPYVAALPYILSCYVNPSVAQTMSVSYEWWSATGTYISSTNGGVVSAPATTWTRLQAPLGAGLAPAGAAYIGIRLNLASTTGATIDVAAWQLETPAPGASVASGWHQGHGCPRVLVTGVLGHSARPLTIRDATLTLKEI